MEREGFILFEAVLNGTFWEKMQVDGFSELACKSAQVSSPKNNRIGQGS